MKSTILFVLLLITLTVTEASAQELIANIGQDNAGSQIQDLQSNDDWAVFSANDGVNGERLYVIAEPGATPMPFAAGLGDRDVTISRLFLVGDKVYYSAREPASAGAGATESAYAADLPSGTPTLIIRNGTANFGAQSFTAAVGAGDKAILFFAVGGSAIWESDGTEAGTRYVTTTNGNAANAIAYGDAAIWTGAGQLYRTDGTEAGTLSLRRFGSSFTDASEPIVANDRVYVVGRDTDGALTLFTSDGTVSGTFPRAAG